MYKLTILENPSGTWSFFGSIPTILCETVPATKSDVLGCRAFRASDGTLQAYKTPTFKTREDAINFAESKGIKI